jgi:hypothetical protein
MHNGAYSDRQAPRHDARVDSALVSWRIVPVWRGLQRQTASSERREPSPPGRERPDIADEETSMTRPTAEPRWHAEQRATSASKKSLAIIRGLRYCRLRPRGASRLFVSSSSCVHPAGILSAAHTGMRLSKESGSPAVPAWGRGVEPGNAVRAPGDAMLGPGMRMPGNTAAPGGSRWYRLGGHREVLSSSRALPANCKQAWKQAHRG